MFFLSSNFYFFLKKDLLLEPQHALTALRMGFIISCFEERSLKLVIHP